MRQLQTFEYESSVLTRDADDNIITSEVLLPKEGAAFPRIRCGDAKEVRDEVLRIHHELISETKGRNVRVACRPFPVA